MSTIQSIGSLTVNTVFIDGDDRYEAVKLDWENYGPLVMSGGYVVFDDYVGEDNGGPKGLLNQSWRATSWGQVSCFVDQEVLPNLARLGFEFDSKVTDGIAFRKV
jgi:hypothetical protein